MLKPFMVFSRGAGAQEGAGVVLAHNSQEAKKVGWQYFHDEIVFEYIDVGVNLAPDWILEEADPTHLANDEPYGFYPKGCDQCEMWGQSRIGDDGLCDDCRVEMVREQTAGDVYPEA